MRLRKPTQELPEECKNISLADSFKKTFPVELITPLYGGGVEAGVPDLEMPIRVSAIRGQLRFWWRLLNPKKGFQEEREIWGGVSDGGATASQVIIRIKDMPKKVEKKSCAQYQRKNKHHWQQGVGYALGIQNEPDNTFLLDPKANKKIGFKLELRIMADREKARDIWEQNVLQPLRWWASFGGLGARTRRGLGSVKITDLTPIDKNEAVAMGCKLVRLTSNSEAIDAWTKAVGKLMDFRQGIEIGRDKGPDRSRWPEADSIREITGRNSPNHYPEHLARQSFPRAAFGLPIITHFNDNREPADTTLKPRVNGEVQERMASPLILKAMWTGEHYQPIALLLPYNNNIGLRLEGNGRNLPKDMPTIDTWWSTKHRKAMTSDTNNPLAGKTGNVLQDFLDFFQGK